MHPNRHSALRARMSAALATTRTFPRQCLNRRQSGRAAPGRRRLCAQEHAGQDRKDKTECPIEAARELAPNALAHWDYGIHTQGMPIQLQMPENRLIITNPEDLYGRLTVNQLGKVQPDTRNPAIANAMEVLGLTENQHSGMPTVLLSSGKPTRARDGLPEDKTFKERPQLCWTSAASRAPVARSWFFLACTAPHTRCAPTPTRCGQRPADAGAPRQAQKPPANVPNVVNGRPAARGAARAVTPRKGTSVLFAWYLLPRALKSENVEIPPKIYLPRICLTPIDQGNCRSLRLWPRDRCPVATFNGCPSQSTYSRNTS